MLTIIYYYTVYMCYHLLYFCCISYMWQIILKCQYIRELKGKNNIIIRDIENCMEQMLITFTTYNYNNSKKYTTAKNNEVL